MNNAEIGATVQLVSGGPIMTVKAPGQNGRVYCQWFAGKKLEQGEFPLASLNPAPVPSTVPMPTQP
jgi:uncharacterized protein YodC (DUF2158 family)